MLNFPLQNCEGRELLGAATSNSGVEGACVEVIKDLSVQLVNAKDDGGGVGRTIISPFHGGPTIGLVSDLGDEFKMGLKNYLDELIERRKAIRIARTLLITYILLSVR